MARPKKQVTEKLTARFPTTQCTTGELAALRSRAAQAGMAVTHYVRHRGLSDERIIIQKQSPLELALLHRFKDNVGKQLNQIAHRANSAGVLPQPLKPCLARLTQDLNYVLYTLQIYDEYASSEGTVKPGFLSQIFDENFAHQLIRVGTNLVQLLRVAEQTEDSRLNDLVECHQKLEPLVDRIISGIN